MGIGSGLGGQFGVKTEAVYGTYNAPDRFFEIEKSGLDEQKITAQGGGLGRLVAPASRRVVAGRSGGGAIDLEVINKWMGIWLQAAADTSTIAQQGATAAWLQTHVISAAPADASLDSLTVQQGVPDVGGVVHAETYLGCVVKSATFSCAKDGMLMSNWDLDARQVTDAQVLAAASQPSGVAPFHWAQTAVKIGALGAEATVAGIAKVDLKVERPSKDDRRNAGGAGLKDKPVQNALTKVTGSFDSEYVDKTVLQDRFTSDGTFSLIWEFIGPVIAGTNSELIRFRAPACKLDGRRYPLDGPDVVNGTFPFAVLSDGVNPPLTIEYQSVDTTIA